MHYLATNPAGLFVFDEENKLIKFKYFGDDPEEAAKKLYKVENDVEISELNELRKEFKDIVTKQPNQGTEYLRSNFREIMLDTGKFKNQNELNKFLSSVSIEKSRLTISKKERRDKLIIQSVSALSDMEKILNTIMERLREWYGLHYPELDVRDHEKYAKLVAENGFRENFREFKKSMGMEFKDDDVKIIQSYAEEYKQLSTLKKNLEKYLEKIVGEEIPNLSALLGCILAARMLALAGSLERMAKMPSSSIQLLGAEKSLFKFLKGKGKEKVRPPRFGILYLHPDITGTKRELQGKIARALSSKLTLAARTDFYTKKDISEELIKEYRKKVDAILKS